MFVHEETLGKMPCLEENKLESNETSNMSHWIDRNEKEATAPGIKNPKAERRESSPKKYYRQNDISMSGQILKNKRQESNRYHKIGK